MPNLLLDVKQKMGQSGAAVHLYKKCRFKTSERKFLI